MDLVQKRIDRKNNKLKKKLAEINILTGKISENAKIFGVADSQANCPSVTDAPRMDEKESRKRLRDAREEKHPGPKMVVTMKRNNGCPLSHAEFRDLVHYSVIGPVVNKPRWCYVTPWKSVSQTVLVRVNTPKDYLINSDSYQEHPFLDTFFDKTFFKTDSEIYDREAFWNGFLSVPVSVREQLKEKLLKLDPLSNEEKKGRLKSDLLLSGMDMADYDYPFPNGNGIVPTKEMYSPIREDSPLFALDCEMCITSQQASELTRISLIREDGSVVLDTLVQTKHPITNYVTKFSGITPEMMEHANVSLEDVQETLRAVLPADAILVGHSLEFDLRALRMSHPYIIDVGRCYNVTGGSRSRTSLKNLVNLFLDEEIQSGRGHCSVEDSWAAMRLAQKKLEHGLIFGNMLFGWSYDAYIKKWENEQALKKCGNPDGPQAKKICLDELTPVKRALPNLCSCGERIGMDCIVLNCPCQVFPPKKCVLCLSTTKYVETRADADASFDWAKAVRVDQCTKTRPLNYYLADTKKTALVALHSLKETQIPTSKLISVLDPKSFKDQADFVDEVSADVLSHALCLTELDFENCQRDYSLISQEVNEQVESIVRSSARNALVIVILSSAKGSIAYMRVKQ